MCFVPCFEVEGFFGLKAGPCCFGLESYALKNMLGAEVSMIVEMETFMAMFLGQQ